MIFKKFTVGVPRSQITFKVILKFLSNFVEVRFDFKLVTSEVYFLGEVIRALSRKLIGLMKIRMRFLMIS